MLFWGGAPKIQRVGSLFDQLTVAREVSQISGDACAVLDSAPDGVPVPAGFMRGGARPGSRAPRPLSPRVGVSKRLLLCASCGGRCVCGGSPNKAIKLSYPPNACDQSCSTRAPIAARYSSLDPGVIDSYQAVEDFGRTSLCTWNLDHSRCFRL